MNWNDLTPEEQATVQNFLNGFLRPLAAKFKQDKDMFESLMASWFATVSPLVTSLAAGEPIPNTSDLGGAQGLTKEQVQTLAGWVDERNNDSFDLQLATLAAGVNAVVSGVEIVA